MSKKLKVIIGIVFAFVILTALVWGIWYWFTRQAFPTTSGSVQVKGVKQPVEILRDEFGVAHIYAQNPQDLFFSQGYVHAQERFWQMEFQRRVASGRLSEIFGESTLETDRYLRHFGFQQLTEKSYAMLDDESRRVVDAYTAGVNAYIADRSPAELGLEFGLLGLQGIDIEIETWQPSDSMIWAEMMIFDQSDQLSTELGNVALLAAVGEDMYNDMRPAYREDRPVIIATEELDYLSQQDISPLAALPDSARQYLFDLAKTMQSVDSTPKLLADMGFQINAGSNSFVVSGDLTETGMPLLANDPHMSVNMPALWYEIGMHCVEKSDDCIYNLRGFSLPGVPGILIGHNDRIAWGLTNAAFDAEDVFIERINPQNPNQYQVNGKWVDMDIRREEIIVRGREDPEVLFVRSTRNGVIATDNMVVESPYSYLGDQLDLHALSYAWTALEPIRSAQAVFMVNRAQDWGDFVEALANFDAGKQNWVFADLEGNIGYYMPGKIPVRAGGDGSLPVPGWNDDFIWTGYIPFEELPHVYNPEQGFVATSNNPQVRYAEYPYIINTSQDRGQRAQRVTEMIRTKAGGITAEDMLAIQTDNYSVSAFEIIPYLADIRFEDPDVDLARDRLFAWDGQMHMDSPEAALFNIFWVHLLAATFHDQLPEDLYPDGDHMVSDTIYWLLQDPANVWWDDINSEGKVELRDDILKDAFVSAYIEAVDTLGDDVDQWSWGSLHTITFRNATLGRSGISLIENIFNRGPFPTSGSESVIQKTCWSTNEPYEVNCIPALRQVLNLADLSQSNMIHSVGQSGHPYHPHYDDFIDAWRTFDYHPSNWTRADVEAGQYEKLVLEPER